jgi:hypothetical protein
VQLMSKVPNWGFCGPIILINWYALSGGSIGVGGRQFSRNQRSKFETGTIDIERTPRPKPKKYSPRLLAGTLNCTHSSRITGQIRRVSEISVAID